MKKIIFFWLLAIILVAGCSKQPKKPFCGDNICDANEKKDGCAADCGSSGSITKLKCENAKGHWNECGSPCAGTGADVCIQVCSAQCECGSIAGFKCPEGSRCRLTGKIADEMGVCVKG